MRRATHGCGWMMCVVVRRGPRSGDRALVWTGACDAAAGLVRVRLGEAGGQLCRRARRQAESKRMSAARAESGALWRVSSVVGCARARTILQRS